MAWPTEIELADDLAVAGLRTGRSDVYEDEARLLAAAKAELERRTGWRPFVSGPSGSVTVRKNGRVIELASGLLTVEFIAIDGEELEEGIGYRLLGSEPPYRGFELAVCPRDPITFSGVLGFCTDANLPADVREAVLDWCKASYSLRSQTNAADMVTTRTDQNSMTKSKSLVDRWHASFDSMVRRYKRNYLW